MSNEHHRFLKFIKKPFCGKTPSPNNIFVEEVHSCKYSLGVQNELKTKRLVDIGSIHLNPKWPSGRVVKAAASRKPRFVSSRDLEKFEQRNRRMTHQNDLFFEEILNLK